MGKNIFRLQVAPLTTGLFIFLLGIIPLVHAATPDVKDTSGAQQFEDFDLAGYGQNGTKQWDVKGDNADVQGDTVALTNIVANSYGDQKMNLTAKSGQLDKANGNMHLEKDVVVTSQTGAQLMTDSLDWHKEKDLVTTNDDVFLSKDGMTATGNGAVVHPNQNTAQINRNVVVNVNTTPKAMQGHIITITSDGSMEVEYTKGTAVFTKNVVAVDGDRKIVADKMTILVDPKTNQIQEMVCIGNVGITQGENTAHAQQANYKAGDQKLILSGRPKLVFYTQGDSKGPFGGK